MNAPTNAVHDRTENLICQAIGDYFLYRSDPEIWEMYRLKHAQGLSIRPDSLDDEIAARLRKETNGAKHELVTSYPELSDKAKHGLAWQFVETVLPHTEADPVALLAQYLVAAGVLMGRKSYFRIEGDKHFPNTNVVMVGETSKARKGTSWGRVKQAFGDALDDVIATGLASGEGLIAHLKDSEVVPPKEKRLLALAPEMSRVLKVSKREGNILSDIVREAWDSGNLRSMTRGDPMKVDGAHIGIIGHITRDELLKQLHDTDMANGFCNRFLWLCVKRSKELPFGGDMEAGALMNIQSDTQAAIDAVLGRHITWEPAAAKMWGGIYGALSEGQPGLIGAMLGRAEAQVVRLSVIHALLNRAHIIRVSDLEAALALWEYCDQSVKHLFGTLTGDQLADRICTIITNKGQATKTDISNLLGRNLKSTEIQEALDFLFNLELINVDTERRPGAKRPTTLYSLN